MKTLDAFMPSYCIRCGHMEVTDEGKDVCDIYGFVLSSKRPHPANCEHYITKVTIP